MNGHHTSVTIGGPLLAAVTFFTNGLTHLVNSGLTWQVAATLLAGLGSVLIGGASFSREMRGWYFKQPPKGRD